jgi:hypothetical protein
MAMANPAEVAAAARLEAAQEQRLAKAAEEAQARAAREEEQRQADAADAAAAAAEAAAVREPRSWLAARGLGFRVRVLGAGAKMAPTACSRGTRAPSAPQMTLPYPCLRHRQVQRARWSRPAAQSTQRRGRSSCRSPAVPKPPPLPPLRTNRTRLSLTPY